MAITPEQVQAAVDAMARCGTQTAAALHLGIARETLQRHLKIATSRGLIGSPPVPYIGRPSEGFVVSRNKAQYDSDGNVERQWIETKPGNTDGYEIPDGHVVKGESALLDANGNVIAKWVKTREDGTPYLIDALIAAFQGYSCAAPEFPVPEATVSDLLTIYPLADLHFGMYSWSPETGDNYDADLAEALARRSIQDLIASSKPSKRAIILGLGDLFHQNDQKNVTPRSGHRLDVDGRWGRIFAMGAKLMTTIVDLVAQKHEQIDVVLLPGNHDEDAAVCLRVALSLFYGATPRINVHNEPGLHWYSRFGRCLFGATHGHTMKPDRMAMMLASDRPEDWGETRYRHFFFGHIHHESAKEVGPVRVESFQTPAPRDAHAQGVGYRSGRSMQAITFDANLGEIGRHRVNILPLEAAI